MIKNTALIFALLGFVLTSCIVGGWNQVTGNGHVVEEDRNITGFTGVHVSSGIDVVLSEGETFEVVVEADENLHEYIETYRSGDMLVVGVEERVSIGRARAKRVHVTLPFLDELKISSAGDCEGITPFHCEELRISISSAGDLNLEVEAESIDLDISSSGDCRLAGSTHDFNVDLSSAGDLQATDLVADRVDVEVSSAGDAHVYAAEEISMKASSAGNIYYSGEAKVIRSSESSAGNIIKR